MGCPKELGVPSGDVGLDIRGGRMKHGMEGGGARIGRTNVFNNGEWTAAVVFEAAHRAGHLLAHGARRRGGGARGWATN